MEGCKYIKMLMKIISHIIKKLARIILSNEQYARYLGVKIGGGI